MKKIHFIAGLLLFSCVFFAFKVKDEPKKTNTATKPNVIVIMVDDLGYQDVSFNGSTEISTPNIDRIANNGIKFTNAHVSYSVCGPSRAGFITGRYPQRFGFERNPIYEPNKIEPGLPLTESTIAETLGTNYTSGIIGKWHLGAHPNNHPLNRGFSEFYGHLGGGHRYLPEELTIQDSYAIHSEDESYRTWILKNHTPVKTDKYLTEEFSDEAVSFIQNHASDAKPFFLFLSYNAPHGPLQATQKYLDRFPNLSGDRKIYAAMVSAVDDGVGAVLNQLETSGIDDNTVVFFLSDNGGKTQYSKNNPLRGGKSSIYEGGFRVPFAMQYKGKVSSGVYNKPISALDIYATAIGLAGATQKPEKPLDGVNLIPYLTNGNSDNPHSEIYLRKFDQQRYSVQKDGYKLVSYLHSGKHELYDLNNDVAETTDIYDDNQNIVDELAYLRKSWVSQLIDPVFKGITNPPNYASKSPSDYLVNHNFELGNKTGWNNWNNGTTNSNANSGFNAGYIRANKIGSLKQIVELKANTTYQIKFWYKSKNGGEIAKVNVKDEVTGTKFIDDQISVSTAYVQYDNTFITGAEKNPISLNLVKHIAANSNLYADDFELQEVGSSAAQYRIKTDDLTTLKVDGNYQAKAVEIPLTSWLGRKKWEILNGTGTASIDEKGVITAESEGTITLKVSAVLNPSIFDEVALKIEGTLGLENEKILNEEMFSVFGSNVVDETISIKNNQHLSNVTVQIYSLSGNLITKNNYAKLDENQHSFNVSNISAGMYFLELKSAGKRQIIKFIKK